MKKKYLEQNCDGVVSGVVCARDPAARFVDLFFGEILLRRIPAHIERSDIAGADVRGFWFSLDPSLIPLLPENTVLEVKDTDGRPLPLSRNAKVGAIGSANDRGDALIKALDRGSVIDKWGALKIPFSAEPEKRRTYAIQMSEVIKFFSARGLIAFPHYGTLLGLVRNGAFIDHDDDVDLSIAINGSSLDEVVSRYYDLVESLIKEGHVVDLLGTGQIQFCMKGSQGPLLDVFLTWATSPLEFNTYFGVAGSLTTPLTYADVELEGQSVKIPVPAEEILALTFGPNWRVPDRHFVWQTPKHIKSVMDLLQAAGRSRLSAILER